MHQKEQVEGARGSKFGKIRDALGEQSSRKLVGFYSSDLILSSCFALASSNELLLTHEFFVHISHSS